MKSKNIKWTLVLILIVVVWTLLYFFDVENFFTFENLHDNKTMLTEYVGSNYVVSVLMYIGIYIIILVLALPGAAIMSISGGVLFGVLPAMIYVNIAATSGATLSFLLSRYLIGSWVQNKYKSSLSKFNREIDENGKNYLITLRLIPIVPFFTINLGAGLTKITVFTFIWTTSLGMIPASFAYVLAGNNLSNIQSFDEILSKEVIFVFIILGLLSLVHPLSKKYREKK